MLARQPSQWVNPTLACPSIVFCLVTNLVKVLSPNLQPFNLLVTFYTLATFVPSLRNPIALTLLLSGISRHAIHQNKVGIALVSLETNRRHHLINQVPKHFFLYHKTNLRQLRHLQNILIRVSLIIGICSLTNFLQTILQLLENVVKLIHKPFCINLSIYIPTHTLDPFRLANEPFRVLNQKTTHKGLFSQLWQTYLLCVL
jgi:hypothetical protein